MWSKWTHLLCSRFSQVCTRLRWTPGKQVWWFRWSEWKGHTCKKTDKSAAHEHHSACLSTTWEKWHCQVQFWLPETQWMCHTTPISFDTTHARIIHETFWRCHSCVMTGLWHGTLSHTPGSIASKLCIAIPPWIECECLHLPVGVTSSADIFQEKISKLMFRLEFTCVCIDDLMIWWPDDPHEGHFFEDHWQKMEMVCCTDHKKQDWWRGEIFFGGKRKLNTQGFTCVKKACGPSTTKWNHC